METTTFEQRIAQRVPLSDLKVIEDPYIVRVKSKEKPDYWQMEVIYNDRHGYLEINTGTNFDTVFEKMAEGEGYSYDDEGQAYLPTSITYGFSTSFRLSIVDKELSHCNMLVDGWKTRLEQMLYKPELCEGDDPNHPNYLIVGNLVLYITSDKKDKTETNYFCTVTDDKGFILGHGEPKRIIENIDIFGNFNEIYEPQEFDYMRVDHA